MSDLVILLSGGMDSALLAYWYGIHAKGLFIDYRQPASVCEANAARDIASKTRLRGYWEAGVTLGGHCLSGVDGPRVMTGRNLALIGIASTFVQAGGVVMLGATAEDLADYKDCRPGFFSHLSSASMAAYNISVLTPLINLTKPEVAALLPRDLIAASWSCYEPDLGDPCGACNSCLARAKALETL